MEGESIARQRKNQRDEFSDLSFIPVLSPTSMASPRQTPEGRQPWTMLVLAVSLQGHRVCVTDWGLWCGAMRGPNDTEFPSPTTAGWPGTAILLCPHSLDLTTV